MSAFSLAMLFALAAGPSANAPAKQPEVMGDPKVVCRLVTEPGSRIPLRVCRTQGDWDRMAKENQDDWRNSRNSRQVACNDINCQ